LDNLEDDPYNFDYKKRDEHNSKYKYDENNIKYQNDEDNKKFQYDEDIFYNPSNLKIIKENILNVDVLYKANFIIIITPLMW